ncbi:MAG: universal stress protein [Candidatus Geothermarchaeales archaeon]
MISLLSEEWGTYLGLDRLLLPLEGFPAEMEAVEVALYLAECSDAEVLLFHVVEASTKKERAYGRLKLFALERAESLDVKVQVEEAEREAPTEAIVKRARAHDLIVMGGRRRLREEILGSVSSAVIRKAPKPQMIITSPIVTWEGRKRPLRKLLVPLRLGREDVGAVKLAAALTSSATTRDFVISALHVITLPQTVPVSASDNESLRDEEKRFLREVGELTSHVARPIIPQVVVGRDVGRSIVNFAREHAFDLIILGERKKPGLLRRLLGAKAHYVARNAPCGVALIYTS